MSSFYDFKFSDVTDESLEHSKSSATISGTGWLLPGEHVVKIDSITPYAEYNSLLLRFKDLENKKASMMLRVFEVDEDTKRPTGTIGSRFYQAVRAILGTESRADEFLKLLRTKPHLLESLTGMSCKVTVAKSKRGYKIVPAAADKFKVVDAGDGGLAEALELFKSEDRVFDSYKDARAAVSEFNESAAREQIMKPSYDSVVYINRSSQEDIDANVAALQTIKDAAATPGGIGSVVDLTPLDGLDD